jgi:hypothetical protein
MFYFSVQCTCMLGEGMDAHIAYAVCKQRRRVYAYSKVPIVLSS